MASSLISIDRECTQTANVSVRKKGVSFEKVNCKFLNEVDTVMSTYTIMIFVLFSFKICFFIR